MAQTHLLVAGATGSGKSVVVNGIIYNGIHRSPDDFQMVLIDPKRVELAAYRYLPHTILYASEPKSMVDALTWVMAETEARFTVMQREGLKKYNGSDIWVIIDEFADLICTNRRQVESTIQRLSQLGRAAKVHLLVATQCPLSSVITTPIKVNLDARVGLRTRSAQDSRNIIGTKGCESLPRYGEGYYMTPEGMDKIKIPMYTEEQIQELIDIRLANAPKHHSNHHTGGLFGFIRRLFAA